MGRFGKVFCVDLYQTANPKKVSIGNQVNYSLIAKSNKKCKLYNLKLMIVVPNGMSKPTNILLIYSKDGGEIKEGAEHENGNGDYYIWDETSNELTVYISKKRGLCYGEEVVLLYKSTVLFGENGENKETIVTLFKGQTQEYRLLESLISISVTL